MSMKNKTNTSSRLTRHQLLCEIVEAIRKAGGTVYFKTPLVMWADDIGGQVPLVVRRVSAITSGEDQMTGFEVGENYSDIHFDMQGLKELIIKIKE